MRGGAGALGSNGAFLDLQNNITAGRVFFRNILLGNARRIAALALALDDLVLLLEVGRQDVPVMKKGIFLDSDIHKRRLEPVLQIAHLALENTGHQALDVVALDGEVLQLGLVHDGHARLQRLGADDNLLAGRLFGQQLTNHPFDAGDDAFLVFLFLGLGIGFRLQFHHRFLFLDAGRLIFCLQNFRLMAAVVNRPVKQAPVFHVLPPFFSGSPGRFVFHPAAGAEALAFLSLSKIFITHL